VRKKIVRPDNYRYQKTHEWAFLVDEETAIVGITDYLSGQLGDMAYIDLPDVEDRIEVGDPFCEIEILDGIHELISPVEGDIIAVNWKLVEDVNLLKKDPYGEGWIIRLKIKDPNEVEDLYDLDAYEETLELS
jgi:glycine cleavage system H protein